MDVINEQVQDDVRRALADDPRIPYAGEIAVEADGDTVVLRGTVGSFGERHAAVADARRTRGVRYVYDEIQVRPLDRDKREDAEIRGAALRRLVWDPELRADDLDVHVKDGWVTVKGDVDHQFQSDRVFDHVASLSGVTGVTNHIKVVQVLPSQFER
jgi:osmotically-inducible protein OsmY